MLLELLKRDLRLHYDALLLPFLFALVMAGLYPFNPELPVFGPVLGFVFAAFLPMVLHLREQHAGSLGDLAGLPVSRQQIVQLRFLEGFLLPSLLLGITVFAMALITRSWPGLPNGEILRGLGWALIFCCAFHLPLTLRWDAKGLLSSFGILFVLGTGLSLTQFLPTRIHLGFWSGLNHTVFYFMAHPHLHSLLILGLLALCFHLSTRALAARDL